MGASHDEQDDRDTGSRSDETGDAASPKRAEANEPLTTSEVSSAPPSSVQQVIEQMQLIAAIDLATVDDDDVPAPKATAIELTKRLPDASDAAPSEQAPSSGTDETTTNPLDTRFDASSTRGPVSSRRKLVRGGSNKVKAAKPAEVKAPRPDSRPRKSPPPPPAEPWPLPPPAVDDSDSQPPAAKRDDNPPAPPKRRDKTPAPPKRRDKTPAPPKRRDKTPAPPKRLDKTSAPPEQSDETPAAKPDAAQSATPPPEQSDEAPAAKPDAAQSTTPPPEHAPSHRPRYALVLLCLAAVAVVVAITQLLPDEPASPDSFAAADAEDPTAAKASAATRGGAKGPQPAGAPQPGSEQKPTTTVTRSDGLAATSPTNTLDFPVGSGEIDSASVTSADESKADESKADESDADESDEAPAELPDFNPAEGSAAVAAAAGAATGCSDGKHKGRAPMSVTFSPSGRVTAAVVAGYSPLAGTTVGSCIARVMRSARVSPFKGAPVTVRKTVIIN